jgi:hypothetical protein
MRKFSSTVSSGNTSRPSGTWTMPLRTTLSGAAPAMFSPPYMICPFSGSMTPEMVFISVVLPAPLAPSTVTI